MSAVADLRGLKLVGASGWGLWAAAHLAFMPDDENRVSLLVKWLWAVLSQQRGDLLITGMPSQHVGLEGSGAPFPMGIAGETSIADMGGAMAEAIDNFRNAGKPQDQANS